MNSRLTLILNSAVAAFFLIGGAKAQTADLDYLFDRLAEPNLVEWQDIAEQIDRALSDSGSAAMNLLLRRGRSAMEARDYAQAVEHYSALIDHAPDFSEGWNGRATAFFAQERYSLALADLEHALALEPRHYNAWQGVGVILVELDRPKLALRAFRIAAGIHPHDPDLRGHLDRLERQLEGLSL